MPGTIYTWPWPTSYTTETDTVPRVKLAKFGDGYEQRTPDGINNLARMVQYVFDFDRATLVQVENFLRYTQGYIPFYYSPPYGPEGLFVADTGWQITEVSFDYATLKATFRELFELSGGATSSQSSSGVAGATSFFGSTGVPGPPGPPGPPGTSIDIKGTVPSASDLPPS